MNIMVSILEFSKNGGGFSSRLRLVPLESAKSFFPSVDFAYYINDGRNVDFTDTAYEIAKKPNYKKKDSFSIKNGFLGFIKSAKEKYDYAKIGGKRRLARFFNVGNMIAYWDIEVGINSTFCTLRSSNITTSHSNFDFTLVRVEFDRKNKQAIFHSSSGKESYVSIIDILDFSVSVKVNHDYIDSDGSIVVDILRTNDGKQIGITSIYEFLEYNEDKNIKSMPILINDVVIQNNDDFYKVAKDFMRGR